MENETKDKFTVAFEEAYSSPTVSDDLQTRLTNASELAEQRARKQAKSNPRGEFPAVFKLGLLASGIVGVTIGGTLWTRHLNYLPDRKIPATKLPSPNAYDYFIKAASVMVAGEHEQKLEQPSPLGFRGRRYRIEARPLEKDKRPPLAQREHLLAKNTEALDILRQGLVHDSGLPSPNIVEEKAFAHWEELRYLGNLLGFACQVYQDEGKHVEATRSACDLIEYGVKTPKGGGRMTHGDGARFEDLGYAILRQNIMRFSLAECKNILARIEKIESYRDSFREVATNEKYGAVMRLEASAKEGQRWVIVKYLPNMKESKLNYFIELMTTPMSKSIKNVDSYFAEVLIESQKPYSPTNGDSNINTTLDPMTSWSLSACDPRFGGIRYTRVQSQLLLAELGIRSYQLEKHQLPANLQDLVTAGYLKSVPLDTFGPTFAIPLSYKRLSENNYLLYSYGPDGKDNHGVAYQGKRPRSWGYAIYAKNENNSNIDMVSGKFGLEIGEESAKISDYRR
jgi:hypothetical protein